MDNIAVAKFSASDRESDTQRHKNCSKKFKEHEKNGKKYRKKKSSLYCSLHGENKSHTSGEFKVLNIRAKDKENPKYGKNHYRKNFKELNILQAEDDHQKSKYENINNSFNKKKTSKEETVVLDDTSDSNSS